ncbi:hypothetical protein KR100_01970 [Synechococcus sp. KORDI-100]|uniref:hypothetical protein n=1 Tax=Synechococcus sp. KORDI-100 TaxID=1280380 RepID=UPI0004E070D8|nr:hypothetical protein [Synechococcus sp. KORDI-100]AII42171.1 hypothetical protein KR100_01970 [Synechococcus sp. KORDI-100]
MPAKIRTIRGKFNNRNGLIDFNRPIGPRGGTDGLITAKQNGRVTRIKLFQDINEDGRFSKDELIFKGKTSDATHDELTNTSRLKFTRQLHSCTWDIMKGNKPIACTLDFVPTAYKLTLDTPAGKIVPEGLGRFEDDQLFMVTIPKTSDTAA